MQYPHSPCRPCQQGFLHYIRESTFDFKKYLNYNINLETLALTILIRTLILFQFIHLEYWVQGSQIQICCILLNVFFMVLCQNQECLFGYLQQSESIAMYKRLQKNAVPIAITLALGAFTTKYVSNKITIRELAKTQSQNDQQEIKIALPSISPTISPQELQQIPVSSQSSQKQSEVSQKEESPLPEKQIIQEQTPQAKIQDKQQEEAMEQNVEYQKTQQKKKEAEKRQKINKPDLKTFLNSKNIADLPQFDLQTRLPDDEFALVVIDMPYTPKFQQQIMAKLKNTIKTRKSNKQVNVYRLKVDTPETIKLIKQIHGADFKEETVLLLKNPYEQNFNMINFNFDMYVQYPQLVNVYLSDLQIINQQNFQTNFEARLKEMPDNETFVLMLCDESKPEEFVRKRLTAKYIQMELGLHKLDGLKLFMIDEKLAKQQNILKNPKSTGLHLIRKKNLFTYATPNRWLFGNMPFHVIENINLYDKKRQIMIPKYLSKIQTFNSMSLNAPIVCSVIIDRNKIQPWEEEKILKIIANLKKNEVFPYLSYVLKFAEVEYAGKDEDVFRNKKWLVKVANLQALDRQILVHQAHTHQDLQKIGVPQENWQRNSYQYLYKYPEITQKNLIEFINNVIENKEEQFYKSQKHHKLQNLKRQTGQTFNQEVLNQLDTTSHLVFEYSDHCPSCQMLSPGMEYLSDVFKLFPDLKTTFHSINCDRNRVQGQPYSPYTPNIYYYSKNWKNKWPLRYPILDFVNSTGIKGIYDFCQISEQLKPVDYGQFRKHIKVVMENNPFTELFA